MDSLLHELAATHGRVRLNDKLIICDHKMFASSMQELVDWPLPEPAWHAGVEPIRGQVSIMPGSNRRHTGRTTVLRDRHGWRHGPYNYGEGEEAPKRACSR